MFLRYKSGKKYFLKFISAEELLCTIEELYKRDILKSKLYLHKTMFYLVFCEEPQNESIKNKYTLYTSKYIENYLQEYGKLLSKNAIKEIGSKL